MEIFFTSSGGAGNFAHRFRRDIFAMFGMLRLQRQALSESRTTRYFFFPIGSTRDTPPIEPKSFE